MMKVYGCKVKSLIDGGAPGYFIIGPFPTKEMAEVCAKEFNEHKKSEAVYDVLHHISIGYFEGIDSDAKVVEIPIIDYVPGYFEEVEDDYLNKIFEGEREKREKLEKLNERVDNIFNRLNLDTAFADKEYKLSSQTKAFNFIIKFTCEFKKEVFYVNCEYYIEPKTLRFRYNEWVCGAGTRNASALITFLDTLNNRIRPSDISNSALERFCASLSRQFYIDTTRMLKDENLGDFTIYDVMKNCIKCFADIECYFHEFNISDIKLDDHSKNKFINNPLIGAIPKIEDCE